MIGKNNTSEILDYFFRNPMTPIHLRELARQTERSTTAVISATSELEEEGLVTIEKGPLTMIRADVKNPRFVRLKRCRNLEMLYESGLIDYLDRKLRPHTIVLFGSYSRGEDTEESDIDIAIIDGEGKEVALDTYERKLDRPVSIHHLRKNSESSLRKNLRNGIVLEGAL